MKVLKGRNVDDEAWYITYIRKAVNSGIIKGISEDEFGIGRELTREDMAVIIVRILKSEKEISYDEKFMDDSEISDYAREAVYLLRTLGIVKGNEDGKYDFAMSLSTVSMATSKKALMFGDSVGTFTVPATPAYSDLQGIRVKCGLELKKGPNRITFMNLDEGRCIFDWIGLIKSDK